MWALLLAIFFGHHDVPSVFHVGKSQNRNEVHYAVRLDEKCSPKGSSPVMPYWVMNERGSGNYEPLLDREQSLYGIGPQMVVGNRVTLSLRAMPSRHIVVETTGDANCTASASTVINGTQARLTHVFVVLGLLSVDRIEIHGISPDGRSLTETVHP